jgi:hypothetical protein
MTLAAFLGPAGVGKTYELMHALREALDARPLDEGQRVLAVTFMHGSRRRLDDRLREIPGLRGRHSCVTVDRFAWELCRRWRSLRRAQGQPDLLERQYNETCEAAAVLMEEREVRSWVARSYPQIIIDEAQDLNPGRLRIFQALELDVAMLVAADEFQCLIDALRPNPAIAWLEGRCQPRVLNVQRRTEQVDLIAGAHAVRAGQTVAAGPNLRLLSGAGRAPYNLAATCVANAIAWNGGADIAVITPSKRGDFATSVVARVGSGPLGQHQNGPFDIHWEQSDDEAARHEAANLNLPEDGGLHSTLAALSDANAHPAVAMCRDWIHRKHRLTGQTVFATDVVRAQLAECFARHRRFARHDLRRLKAMTVHQAKNREFEGVIILWPYTVAGDAEQQRRLLYNGITRAKHWCTIVVQNQSMLNRAPFRA